MTLPPFLQTYLSKLSFRRNREAMNPGRDWLVLLSVALVLLLVSMGWNIWFFSSVLSGKETAASESLDTLGTTDLLEEVQETVEARRAERERYRTEYRFVDPSR